MQLDRRSTKTWTDPGGISFAIPNTPCRDCRFFQPYPRRNLKENEITVGECRYDPPSYGNDDPTGTYWPMVHELQWCGKWTAKREGLASSIHLPDDGSTL